MLITDYQNFDYIFPKIMILQICFFDVVNMGLSLWILSEFEKKIALTLNNLIKKRINFTIHLEYTCFISFYSWFFNLIAALVVSNLQINIYVSRLFIFVKSTHLIKIMSLIQISCFQMFNKDFKLRITFLWTSQLQ